MVKPAFIFDGRNILDHNELMAFGFEVCDFATLKSRFAANVDDVSSCSHIYLFSVFQLDRFLFKIDVKYPNAQEELEIIYREQQLVNTQKLEKVQSGAHEHLYFSNGKANFVQVSAKAVSSFISLIPLILSLLMSCKCWPLSHIP